MFRFGRKSAQHVSIGQVLESLEGRQLLSSAHYHLAVQRLEAQHRRGEALSVILFGQAPAAVQTGLNADATDHGLAALTSSTKVRLGNVSGVEVYSVRVDSTGAVTTLSVDQLGDPITKPSLSKTTFGTLSGTGAGSDTPASDKITAIASALGLVAPGADTSVAVRTSGTSTTYSVRLLHSTATSSKHRHGVLITVDSNGNPVGNEDLPFSTLPTKIQDGLNALLPSGATRLVSDSTQTVNVRTIDGVVLYSTTFASTGTTTTVTVNSAGDAASAPTQTTTTFAALAANVQTAIQTLATANGVAGTIAADQAIDVYSEANGAVLYSATLSAVSKKNVNVTFDITITVDSSGNPTVLPRQNLFGRFRGGRGFAGFGGEGGEGGFTGRGRHRRSLGRLGQSNPGGSSSNGPTL